LAGDEKPAGMLKRLAATKHTMRIFFVLFPWRLIEDR
jgi:hypothetical protein